MYSNSIQLIIFGEVNMITALRMASQAAKEVWWKFILKESATVAIKGTAAETSKKVLDKMNINKRPIKKKLKTLEKNVV